MESKKKSQIYKNPKGRFVYMKNVSIIYSTNYEFSFIYRDSLDLLVENKKNI